MLGPSFYMDEAVVRNHFQLRMVNKRNQPMTITVQLQDPPAGYLMTGLTDAVSMPALKEVARPLVIVVPKESYTGPVKLSLRIHGDPGNTTVVQDVEFLGPNPQMLRTNE